MIAATGHQPTPGIGITEQGEKGRPISIEEVAKACGADYVQVISPYEVEPTRQVLKEAIKMEGLRVIISQGECSLVPKKIARG